MDTKPGLKTTEFWVAMAVVAAAVVGSVYSRHEWGQIAAGIAGALASAGYSFSRAAVKTAAAQQKP